MPRLQLENATDVFDLDEVFKNGRGVQVRSGVTGLGLAPKQVQWLEGAGNGSKYRGSRVLARNIDLPLLVQGLHREDLKDWLDRLSMMLNGPCKLSLVEDDGKSWSTEVVHTGGGDYVYGTDSIGEDDFFTVITVRAGDPFFSYSEPTRHEIKGATAARGLIGRLTALRLSPSQRIGTITLENRGSVEAQPVWTVYGPGNQFTAVSPSGQKLQWNGILAQDEWVKIDTRDGSVVDNQGRNRYPELAEAPRFWAVPPRKSTAECTLLNTTSASSITCTYQPRRDMVI